jgi:hypothetical protein
MSYKFNPEDFGFEHVSNFPELGDWFGNTTFIKVIAIGSKDMGRAVYWYKYCLGSVGMHDDERWKIGSHSFDENKPKDYQGMRDVYCGLISTEEFANSLLCHLMGTTKNDSVLTHGKERLEQNINAERLKFNISHGQEAGN